MRFDMTFFPSSDWRADAAAIQQAETLGFAAAWSAETARSPFLPLTVAAQHSQRIQLGTQIAVAFPRSPMIAAQIAWDLAAQTRGRFILGLGTQVSAHITRRFSEDWHDPLGRIREYIESIRAIWDTFQNDARLRYRGRHYQFRLMAPFFKPRPIEHPDIPIYLAGINPKICRLAGESAQGLHAHRFHTRAYLQERVLPPLEQGLRQAQRPRREFALTVPVLVVTGNSAAEMRQSEQAVKNRIGFYASSPAGQAVLAHHGWQDAGSQLRQMRRAGESNALWQAVPDEMLNAIAILAPPAQVIPKIRARYAQLADRVCIEWQTASPQILEQMTKCF